MINMWTYDVEVLPNFFSVVFVNVVDYINKFEDCKIGKKTVPLTQILKVEEIKNKLANIETYSFYITDTDDSQLFPMIGFINSLMPHRDEKGKAIRNDVFGYNSMSYDKLMIACLLMNATECTNTKELIKKLYDTSKRIIALQDEENKAKDYYIETLKNYKLPYKDVDIMRIFALNKVGVNINANGEKKYYGKGLKQVSINIQWYDIIEYELPQISSKDRNFYKDIKDPVTDEELTKIINKWDRYILPEWIPDTMKYNKNDTFIAAEMIRLFSDEVKLRYNLTKTYQIDLLNSSRSNIADKLFIKFYSEFSGLDYKRWGGKKTERRAMAFNKVIFDNIKFKTPELKALLEDMKNVVIYSVGKDSFQKSVKLGKLTYTLATGGLHSKDIPRELKSKVSASYPFTGSLWSDVMKDDDFVYVHWDISSFYPSIISVYKVAPKHMDNFTFCKLVKWLRDTRIAAKHSSEDYIDGIPKKLLAEALKIVINSIYGKLGYEYGDICDRLAVLKITINGQLMIMMLCEELELNGIEVVSANTDGIVVKLYKSKKELFDNIAKRWMDYTGLSADSEEYELYVNRDINNYFSKEFNGNITYKGALNPDMYLVDLTKGYDMPIVAKAVSDYFINGTPVLDTLYNETNILMFCKTQNVGKQFHVEYRKNAAINELQRYVRFYVSIDGGNLYKVTNVGGSLNNMAAGYVVTILNTLDDRDISVRNINYTYYYKECMKIIDPIKLQISPNQEPIKGKAGKTLIKRYSGQYNTLFDDND